MKIDNWNIVNCHGKVQGQDNEQGYINASYVPSPFFMDHSFIMTQGPLDQVKNL